MLKINKIHQGDCLDRLQEMDKNSVDLIIIDPPYNMIAMDWDKQEIDFKRLSFELFRVLKDYGSLYIFCQMPIGFKIYNDFVGDFEFRQDLIWAKNRGFSLAKTVYTRHHENILFFIKNDKDKWKRFGDYIKERRLKLNYSLKKIGELCEEVWYHRGGHMYYETGLGKPTKEQYNKLKNVLGFDDRFDKELFNNHSFNFEDIKLKGEPYKITREAQKLYGKKSNLGKFTQVNQGKRNPKSILNYNIIQSGKEYVGHPTQKPVELLKYLIKASSNKGDLVLDCFMGSGSTAVACQQLGRNFIGIEKEEKYCKISRERLTQQTLFRGKTK